MRSEKRKHLAAAEPAAEVVGGLCAQQGAYRAQAVHWRGRTEQLISPRRGEWYVPHHPVANLNRVPPQGLNLRMAHVPYQEINAPALQCSWGSQASSSCLGDMKCLLSGLTCGKRRENNTEASAASFQASPMRHTQDGQWALPSFTYATKTPSP